MSRAFQWKLCCRMKWPQKLYVCKKHKGHTSSIGQPDLHQKEHVKTRNARHSRLSVLNQFIRLCKQPLWIWQRFLRRDHSIGFQSFEPWNITFWVTVLLLESIACEPEKEEDVEVGGRWETYILPSSLSRLSSVWWASLVYLPRAWFRDICHKNF